MMFGFLIRLSMTFLNNSAEKVHFEMSIVSHPWPKGSLVASCPGSEIGRNLLASSPGALFVFAVILRRNRDCDIAPSSCADDSRGKQATPGSHLTATVRTEYHGQQKCDSNDLIIVLEHTGFVLLSYRIVKDNEVLLSVIRGREAGNNRQTAQTWCGTS